MIPLEQIEESILGKLKKVGKNGYIHVFLPIREKIHQPGWHLEHRFVIEKFIGRLLNDSEVVHHLNENKTDNRIENLMLFPNQKEHKSFENKMKQFGYTNPIRLQIQNRWKLTFS